MQRLLLAMALLFFISACNSSTEKTDNGSTPKEEWSTKERENLFDTSQTGLRNTDNFHSVEIRQMKFFPEVITVHAGDTVAWINNDIVVHDITEEKNKAWSSSPLPVGSTWQMVANNSVDYFCSIHVMMKGKIVVE
jgi:plastocyanin